MKWVKIIKRTFAISLYIHVTVHLHAGAAEDREIIALGNQKIDVLDFYFRHTVLPQVFLWNTPEQKPTEGAFSTANLSYANTATPDLKKNFSLFSSLFGLGGGGLNYSIGAGGYYQRYAYNDAYGDLPVFAGFGITSDIISFHAGGVISYYNGAQPDQYLNAAGITNGNRSDIRANYKYAGFIYLALLSDFSGYLDIGGEENLLRQFGIGFRQLLNILYNRDSERYIEEINLDYRRFFHREVFDLFNVQLFSRFENSEKKLHRASAGLSLNVSGLFAKVSVDKLTSGLTPGFAFGFMFDRLSTREDSSASPWGRVRNLKVYYFQRSIEDEKSYGNERGFIFELGTAM
ncbi:MAG: hypothetical protein LDLANPLL_00465 [Turneriella sp.]|nr:hypothetical protein [Turneriella sp.]